MDSSCDFETMTGSSFRSDEEIILSANQNRHSFTRSDSNRVMKDDLARSDTYAGQVTEMKATGRDHSALDKWENVGASSIMLAHLLYPCMFRCSCVLAVARIYAHLSNIRVSTSNHQNHLTNSQWIFNKSSSAIFDIWQNNCSDYDDQKGFFKKQSNIFFVVNVWLHKKDVDDLW